MAPEVSESSKPQPAVVKIRWFDGFFRVFSDVIESRAGCDLLWLKLARIDPQTGENATRHIPLRGVRWFTGVR